MSEYMPTTDKVRIVYRDYGWGPSNAARKAEFDRWLAAHDRTVKVEALREAAKALMQEGPAARKHPSTWLGTRAFQIEEATP